MQNSHEGKVLVTEEGAAGAISEVLPVLAPVGRVLVASGPLPIKYETGAEFMEGKPPEYFFGGDAP